MGKRMKVGFKEFIYKQVNGVELIMRCFSSEDSAFVGKKPAMVFFFGGGWKTGTIDQFTPQSKFLASKNFITVVPEYRIHSKHQTTPFECVEDAKDALYWVWKHSSELGIDEEKIAVGGASAGGHLAACTAVLRSDEFDSNEVYKIPKAIVLFNPVCDTSENGNGHKWLGDRKLALSPMHNIVGGLPPTLIFHGTTDITVPFTQTVEFCNRMQQFGNECTLIPYEGRGHSFFNMGNSENNIDYLDTQDRMYIFLKGSILL